MRDKKEDNAEIVYLIMLVKELRQEMLNDDKAQATNSVTAVLYAYDTLLTKIEEKKAA